jgi:hypothetical protein
MPLAVVLLLLVTGAKESSSLPDARPERQTALPMLPDSGERIALASPVPISLTQSRPDARQQNALLTQGEPLTLVVARNDSLDRLFRRNDLSASDLAAMVGLPEASRHLARINPGEKIEIIRDGRQVLSLRKELSDSEELWIRKDEGGFAAEFVDLEIEIRTASAHGTIESSLWNAAIDAGMAFKVIEDLAGIFEWDIDFQLEVRRGDSFTVVFEEIWRDGIKLRNGKIVAAEFVNQGGSFCATRSNSLGSARILIRIDAIPY